MRYLPVFVIICLTGCFISGFLVGHHDVSSLRKENAVLEARIGELATGLEASNTQLSTTAFRLAELEKAAKQVEGPKVSKADFDNAVVEYNDDAPTPKPTAVIIVGMTHRGMDGMKGKDFLYGGRVWFQVVGKMPGQLTLYQFLANEWLKIGGWGMDIPRTIREEDIPEECRPDGHLPVGRYRLEFVEFDGIADREVHAEREFSVVLAGKLAIEKPMEVSIKVLDQKGNPLPEEIPAGTPLVFQLTLPAGEKGEFMLVPATVKGGLRALGKKDVTGPRTEKILESDLSESALQDGRLKPGEYQLIFTSPENGVIWKDFTVSSGK